MGGREGEVMGRMDERERRNLSGLWRRAWKLDLCLCLSLGLDCREVGGLLWMGKCGLKAEQREGKGRGKSSSDDYRCLIWILMLS